MMAEYTMVKDKYDTYAVTEDGETVRDELTREEAIDYILEKTTEYS